MKKFTFLIVFFMSLVGEYSWGYRDIRRDLGPDPDESQLECNESSQYLYTIIKSRRLTNLLIEQTGLGCDLRGAELYQIRRFDGSGNFFRPKNIAESFLMKADLREADFRGSDLEGTILDGANAEGASFKEANLSFTSFKKANLNNVNFYRTIIRNVNFNEAVLTNTNLREADLDFVYLESFREKDVTTGAILDELDLSYLAFKENSYLKGIIAHKINFSHTEMVAIDLSYAELSNANFERAILPRANLENADLSGANFFHANLKGANLRNAILTGANLMHANLEDANMEGTTLDWTYMAFSNLGNAVLNHASMVCTNVAGVKLEDSNFSEAMYSYTAYWDQANVEEAINRPDFPNPEVPKVSDYIDSLNLQIESYSNQINSKNSDIRSLHSRISSLNSKIRSLNSDRDEVKKFVRRQCRIHGHRWCCKNFSAGSPLYSIHQYSCAGSEPSSPPSGGGGGGGGGGSGGCLSENTNVLMANGQEKKINKIEEGDLILNGNGEVVKVFYVVKESKKSEMYNIIFDDSTEITATRDHPFLNFDNVFVTVENIREGDRLKSLDNFKRVESIYEVEYNKNVYSMILKSVESTELLENQPFFLPKTGELIAWRQMLWEASLGLSDHQSTFVSNGIASGHIVRKL